jgi:hypothetical protein
MDNPTEVPTPVAELALALVTAALGPDDGTYERLVAGLGVVHGSDADWAIRGLLALALAALDQPVTDMSSVTGVVQQLGLAIADGS